MPRIYDFQSYASKKNKFFNTQMSFTKEFSYVDIEVVNKPKDLLEFNDVECEIDYQIDLKTDSSGIIGMDFNVSSVELEFKNSEGGETEEIEFEIKPNRNFPESNITYVKSDSLVPSEPTRIHIDMNNSNKVEDFSIKVTFGQDL